MAGHSAATSVHMIPSTTGTSQGMSECLCIFYEVQRFTAKFHVYHGWSSYPTLTFPKIVKVFNNNLCKKLPFLQKTLQKTHGQFLNITWKRVRELNKLKWRPAP